MMEAADGLHGVDQSLSLSRSHTHIFGIPNSLGLLKAPPPSLRRQQPPLLPLPASHLRRSSSALLHSNRNGTRQYHSFTLKKSSQVSRKEENKTPKRSVNISAPGDSDYMFQLPTISPPPSSLPLPTFCLRPKPIGCNAGIDTGATDDIRRLLHLQ